MQLNGDQPDAWNGIAHRLSVTDGRQNFAGLFKLSASYARLEEFLVDMYKGPPLWRQLITHKYGVNRAFRLAKTTADTLAAVDEELIISNSRYIDLSFMDTVHRADSCTRFVLNANARRCDNVSHCKILPVHLVSYA
jgi:hypothetical protein